MRGGDLATYKKQVCERCGFVPEHECQLDVDHKDANHSNNDPSNHQTLCACCHRLKTLIERQRTNLDDWGKMWEAGMIKRT